MRISVKVIARSRRPGVEVVDSEHLVIRVKEPPVDNKANFAVLQAVAEHFRVSLGEVRLVSGATSTHKIIEVIQ